MRICIENLRSLIIGREEDGGVKVVEIDCTYWRRKYPQLTSYRIEVTSPDGTVYFPAITMNGDTIVWPITQSDTATKGRGLYQVVATGADGKQKTSDHPSLVILSTMPGTAQETPPDPSEPWTKKVLEAADRAEAAAERAESAGGNVSDEALTSAVEEALQEAKESGDFDGPKGEKGDPGNPGEDGFSPSVQVEDIDGGHRVTITDKDGEKSFDVLDGKDGAGDGASVQPDWQQNDPTNPAYVQNRTHWMEQLYPPIEWDGSTEGRDSVDLTVLGLGVLYKASDLLLTVEEYQKSRVCVQVMSSNSIPKVCVPISSAVDASQAVDGVPEGFAILSEADLFYTNEDGYESDLANVSFVTFNVAGDFTSTLGIVIPSTGVYCFVRNFVNSFQAIVGLSSTTYHTLDPNYIPETFATTQYVDEAIDNAVGSALGGAY